MSELVALDFAAYERALAALHGLIRGERAQRDSVGDRRARAETRLHRTRVLLERLGNPQHRYATVHVTGTSGKGSTSALIAAILHAAGYRVGLRTSPYLQVATEKLQIGHALIDAEALERVSTLTISEARARMPELGSNWHFTYAEAWSVLSYQWFAERNVDIAVIEVGAGGRFDTTNAISPVVSVVTSVGLDHLLSLGPTLADIAWHKAGIIKPGGIAVLGALSAETKQIIAREAHQAGAPIIHATNTTIGDHRLTMPGGFQRTNSQIATAAVVALRQQGFVIPEAAIAAGMAAARLPGRLEQMPDDGQSPVWLDGAHNADKIAALSHEVGALSPSGELPVIVLGILGAKDASAIAAGIANAASELVITQPEVLGKRPLKAETLAATAVACGYTGRLHVEPDPLKAVAIARQRAAQRTAPVLVTGSMYLVGQVRSTWFADRDVVHQRTPWPKPPG